MGPCLHCDIGPPGQALSRATGKLFLSQQILTLMKAVEDKDKYLQDFIQRFAESFLMVHQSSEKTLNFLKDIPAFARFVESYENMAQLCRCWLEATGHVSPGLMDDPGAGKATFFFSQYTGNNHFAKKIKSILLTEKCFWQRQVQELARTAGSRLVLAPKHNEAKTLAQKAKESPASMSSEELWKLTKLVPELQRGMRAKDFEETQTSILSAAMAMAREMMDTAAASSLSTDSVDAVFNMLLMFTDQPGVETLREEFRAWVQKTHALRNVQVFIQELQSVQVGQVDFGKIRSLIQQELPQVHGSAVEELMLAASHFLHVGLQQLVDKAGLNH